MATKLFDQIIFGPIISRRLGVSLGVNLLPENGKVCSFDCIYCECGYNAQGTGSGLPTREQVKEALQQRLQIMKEAGEKPDVITFAGNGEPTLHPDFSTIINDTIALRDHYFPEAKVSVLSNSTMISRQAVFNALNKVDNNILKLDSVYPHTVGLLNAPNSNSFDIVKLITDLKRFKGNVIIQTMFLRGTHNGEVVDNTTAEEVNGWIEALKEIGPKSVMIYSIDRDTPEKDLQKIDKDELEAIADKARAWGFDVSVAG